MLATFRLRISELCRLLPNLIEAKRVALTPLLNAISLWIDEPRLVQSEPVPHSFGDCFLPSRLKDSIYEDFFGNSSCWWLDLVLPSSETPSFSKDVLSSDFTPQIDRVSLDSAIPLASIALRKPFLQNLETLNASSACGILNSECLILINTSNKVGKIFSQLQELDEAFLNDLAGMYKTIIKRGTYLKKLSKLSEILFEYDFKERLLDQDVLAIVQLNRATSDAQYETETVDSLTCIAALKIERAIEYIQQSKVTHAVFVKEFYRIIEILDFNLLQYPPSEQVVKRIVHALGNHFSI